MSNDCSKRTQPSEYSVRGRVKTCLKHKLTKNPPRCAMESTKLALRDEAGWRLNLPGVQVRAGSLAASASHVCEVCEVSRSARFSRSSRGHVCAIPEWQAHVRVCVCVHKAVVCARAHHTRIVAWEIGSSTHSVVIPKNDTRALRHTF